MEWIDYIVWFFLVAAVLFVIVGIWVAVTYWLTPHVDQPDGRARITGSCGDTMEICLKFKGGRVFKTSCWTDGCAYSFNCVSCAADLARGRNPDQVLEIDADLIQRSVGGLPSDHLHCARLAEETLQTALDDYMKKSAGAASSDGAGTAKDSRFRHVGAMQQMNGFTDSAI
ncbi:MAG: iron-sulfur cluster assembly scaffold protein [Deltaproteobacteria bacterium]|nr:iron-sulfur cluster assembly scaffold protein [Deltaproteobacteria bacterium]